MKNRLRTFLCACTAAAFSAAAVPASAQAPASRSPVHLLDVPYLPQSEALCGGAAAAMVMRYWGASDVYADAFAGLVDPAAGGIHADALARDLRARGWQALTFSGDMPLLRSSIEKGRPVIVLVEDRPGRFHFVVVVAAGGGRVVVHDPARAPFRVLDEASFERAWERAAFWSMVALPPATTVSKAPTVSDAPSATSGPCGRMVDEGVRLAQAGETETAERLFDVARVTCPSDSAPWRERAGIHVLRNEWRLAAVDAREALRRDKADEHAARILATSLFVEGDTLGALAAWNIAGEPIIDLLNVQGLDRTRYAVAAHALGLEPHTLLKADSLRRAQRNAAEIPSALLSRVSYRPGENGRAQVDAVIVERPLLPAGAVGIATIGLRALTDRELAASLASPSGGGELWTASWRWWEHRPRTALSFSAPAAGRMRGVWRIEALDEKQGYASPRGIEVERRRGVAVQLSEWATGRWRWTVSAGADRWRGRGASVSAGASAEHRVLGDRMATRAWGSIFGGAVDSWTAGLAGEYRTRSRNEGGVLLTRASVEAAGTNAPLALWPGAGAGQGRDLLLRAHPLLKDGIISAGVFGRRIGYAGAEWRQWVRPLKRALRIAPAGFVDSARASGGLATFDSRLHIDAGVGLRVAIPGAGVLRMDVAHGLRDGRHAWSLGWTR